MEFVIIGRPISKKNSKNIGVNKYSSRVFITSSSAWKTFESSALSQLSLYSSAQYRNEFYVDYEFHFKGNMSVDIDDAISGINDILELAGIIDNDKNIAGGKYRRIKNQGEWKTIVNIYYAIS